ncbi:hypothetical protein [Mesorhizobium qingshengii]|uniref:hypothetical protein n=1 Tax=Mesorhizobium qingshengii TaxID=1165689 RepID=UPI0011600095|nr:hypothetical protein [Mesorhizobium qingshengii]
MAKRPTKGRAADAPENWREHSPASKQFVAGEPGDQYIFVDGARGFAISGGVARFLLTQEIYDPDSGPINVAATRIAMPLPSFYNLHKWMTTILEQLKAQGVEFEAGAVDDSGNS